MGVHLPYRMTMPMIGPASFGTRDAHRRHHHPAARVAELPTRSTYLPNFGSSEFSGNSYTVSPDLGVTDTSYQLGSNFSIDDGIWDTETQTYIATPTTPDSSGNFTVNYTGPPDPGNPAGSS